MAVVSTYLPVWTAGGAGRRAGDDEDAVTMAVAAGSASIVGEPPHRVVLVSRQLPLLEGGNAAALLAGLGLEPDTEVVEQVGGAPATLDAVAGAVDGTLVISVDHDPTSSAAAAWCAGAARSVIALQRTNRSLPLRVRGQDGAVHQDDDPRLQRERGLLASLRLVSPSTPAAIAGVSARDAKSLCTAEAPSLPTMGASSPLFAIAALAERGERGVVVAVEQATAVAVDVEPAEIVVRRDERPAVDLSQRNVAPGPDIKLAFTAYDRAFESKLGWKAGECPACRTLAMPPRHRCIGCGEEGTSVLVDLPRTGSVYTATTVHIPVPGLASPYSLAVVQLDGVDVRALVHVTDALPGSVELDEVGRLLFRRVAVRSGVPDYGYAFAPALTAVPA